MRSCILVAALAVVAAPAAALTTPKPEPTQPATQSLNELPPDWLDDADLNSSSTDNSTAGAEGDEQLAGSDRGEIRTDLGHECKESSGTTGLILGAVAGGLLGNVIDGGEHRAAGTLLGAGGGALLGRHIEKKRAEASCK